MTIFNNFTGLSAFNPNLSLSADEINKKISELKAIEAWMKMNLMMVQTSIQTLDAQKQLVGGLEKLVSTPNKIDKNSAPESFTTSKPTSESKISDNNGQTTNLWSKFISTYNDVITQSLNNINSSYRQKANNKTEKPKSKKTIKKTPKSTSKKPTSKTRQL